MAFNVSSPTILTFDAFLLSNEQQFLDIQRFFLSTAELSFLKVLEALNDIFGNDSFLLFWEDMNGRFSLNPSNFQTFLDSICHENVVDLILVQQSGLDDKESNPCQNEPLEGEVKETQIDGFNERFPLEQEENVKRNPSEWSENGENSENHSDLNSDTLSEFSFEEDDSDEDLEEVEMDRISEIVAYLDFQYQQLLLEFMSSSNEMDFYSYHENLRRLEILSADIEETNNFYQNSDSDSTEEFEL